MATKLSQNSNNDRLQAVEKQIELHSTAIAQSLHRLLHDEKADTDKMLFKLCKGISLVNRMRTWLIRSSGTYLLDAIGV